MVSMDNLRQYGLPPFQTVVVHGGPGAAGEMAPVALDLSREFGVLEPLQTASSISGQIHELNTILEHHTQLPVTLIGHSWGAWLACLTTATYPEKIKKLILVSSGPFTPEYVPTMSALRQSRLGSDQVLIPDLMQALKDQDPVTRETAFHKFGLLMSQVDTYCPLPLSEEPDSFDVVLRVDIFEQVMYEAEKLRNSGELLRIMSSVTCPVVAIHGDFDPHPYQGVINPLTDVVPNFRYHLLENCGHTPWQEVYAKEEFYDILFSELN